MSSTRYAKPIALLRAAAVHAAWTQWSSFGFAMHGATPGHAVIDPEALMLASLAFAEDERRLDRVMHSWLMTGARLLSASRFGNLMEEYPEGVLLEARSLAAGLVAAGDPRFKRLAGGARPGAETVRPTGAPTGIALRERTAMLLRLRLAFGVGIKADALAYLIGLAPSRHSVRQVSLALGYEERPVRRALEDLAAAGFIAVDATSPVTFKADAGNWGTLLGVTGDLPLWRNWRELYLVAAHLDDWERQIRKDWSDYVQGSSLRDLFDKLDAVLLRCVPDRPDWRRPVDAWPAEFGAWAERVVRLMQAVA